MMAGIGVHLRPESVFTVNRNARSRSSGIRNTHLDYYLDEFTFRFNRRTSRSRGKLFQRLVEQALVVDPVPYKKLVGGGEPWWNSSEAIRLLESSK